MKKKQLIILLTSVATVVVAGVVAATVIVPRLKTEDSLTSTVTSEQSIEGSVIQKYIVTWKNYDGAILEVNESVAHGSMPVYKGDTPVKPRNAEHTYTFSNWSPEVVSAVSDATYIAEFNSAVNHYSVKWQYSDGTPIKVDSVPYGTLPLFEGETPNKAKTAKFSYVFSGWSPEIVVVTSDAIYTATFNETINTYTVTWVDEDGTVLDINNDVPYGTLPEYNNALPEKNEEAISTYTFSGWFPAIGPVTEDVTYTATFIMNFKSFQITLDLNGGTFTDPAEPVIFSVQYNDMYTLPVISSPTTTPFGGWYYNDIQITNEDGEALTNFVFTEDITVIAEFFVPIYTREDFENITNNLNETYRLMNDLDLGGEDWVPINNFSGNFNGQDYVISNMTITTYYESAGLFGTVSEATITNLTMRDTTFEVTEGIAGGGFYTGGIASIIGSASGGYNLTLHRLSNENMTMNLTRNIARYQGIGGIVGLIDARKATTVIITEIENNSDIELEEFQNVGGLIGYVRHEYSTLTIKESVNNGNIISQVDVGGLIGYFYGYQTNVIIENSYNGGEVVSVSVAGGLVGSIALTYTSQLTITNSYNANNITAVYQGVGGLIGSGNAADISGITITESYNRGIITGENRVGGLVGGAGRSGQRTFFPEIEITNSFNVGNVFGIGDHVENIGGFVGGTSLVVRLASSFNAGSVKATQKNVGGFVGEAENGGNIERALNFGVVQGNSSVGIVIGTNKNNSVVISDTYFTNPPLNMNNEPFVNPTLGGTAIASELITETFLSNTLLWNEETWDLSDLDLSNERFPSLR